MSEDRGKQFVDKSARMVRENLEKGVAAAKESARGIEQGYASAAESIRDYNLKLIEMAHANRYGGCRLCSTDFNRLGTVAGS